MKNVPNISNHARLKMGLNTLFKLHKTKAFVLFLLMIVLLPSACHRTKTITKSPSPIKQEVLTTAPPVDAKADALLKQLKNNELPFSELALKLKTKVSSPDLNQSFTTNIRWKKHEKIWMSMSIIGIEGARVLITKDSIKIMDKINNRYILKPLSYIKEKTLVDLSFTDIENLLLGQLVFTDAGKAKYSENTTNININADGVRFLSNVVFDKNSKNPTGFLVTDKKYAQTIDVAQANYQMQLGKPFSMDRELKMKSGAASFEMIAKIQSIESKQNLEYPFYINPAFKIEE